MQAKVEAMVETVAKRHIRLSQQVQLIASLPLYLAGAAGGEAGAGASQPVSLPVPAAADAVSLVSVEEGLEEGRRWAGLLLGPTRRRRIESSFRAKARLKVTQLRPPLPAAAPVRTGCRR